MAIIKANFIKNTARRSAGAKAHIRYIEHRRGKDGVKITRTLFGAYGQMSRQQAYEMIDQAEEGSTYFRLVISPDPEREDTARDLLLREITAKTMDIEEKLGKPVSWVAAIHDDHTPKRHVHILAVVKERLLPVQAMRQAATQSCVEQRRELDLSRQQERERKAQWELQREGG